MKVSDYIIQFLVRQGVRHVFLLIGGAITHLADSLYGRTDIAAVAMHHEQAAAFAADAYARVTGNLGVAMATSGPGALNLLTGIGSCYFDSVSALFITGQVNTYEYKFDRPVRQIGFQETDIVNVAKPLVKYASLVTEPESIRSELEKASYMAKTGRPGPVLLDIPMNVQRAEVDPAKLSCFVPEDTAYVTPLQPSEEDIAYVTQALARARRPLVLVGHGVRLSGATHELDAFLTRTQVPAVTTLMGLDCLAHDKENFYGFIGVYGHRYSNLAAANCDLLLILGSRLDTRQTGTRPETFARGATKIHVDIDKAELGAKIVPDRAIQSDIKSFLGRLNAALEEGPAPTFTDWTSSTLNVYRNKYPSGCSDPAAGPCNPNNVIEQLSVASTEGDAVCLDIGQNQIWAAQSFHVKCGQRLIMNGGLGSMGFSLPAAIGAAMAANNGRVIAIMGDGGAQINIQELETIARHNLNIKVVILNNACLGMVRQFQETYFESRYQSTVIGYGAPNFCKVAGAFGIEAVSLHDGDHVPGVIERFLAHRGPGLLNATIARDAAMNPKLLVNRPVEDMSPYLDRNELQSIMRLPVLEEA